MGTRILWRVRKIESVEAGCRPQTFLVFRRSRTWHVNGGEAATLRTIVYMQELCPNVEALMTLGSLVPDTGDMSAFIQVPKPVL